MASVPERLKQIIVEQLGVDEESVVPSASFIDDLNADSTDLAELIIEIEGQFSSPKQKLVISDDTISQFITVQDLIEYLSDYVTED